MRNEEESHFLRNNHLYHIPEWPLLRLAVFVLGAEVGFFAGFTGEAEAASAGAAELRVGQVAAGFGNGRDGEA